MHFHVTSATLSRPLEISGMWNKSEPIYGTLRDLSVLSQYM